jgi:Trypsin
MSWPASSQFGKVNLLVSCTGLGMLALTALSGCAVGPEGSPSLDEADAVNSKGQAVFNGVPAVDDYYDAVGAIALRYEFEIPGEEPIVYYDQVCTGTLVKHDAIVTARHCTQRLANEMAAGNSPYFLIGDDVGQPEQAVRIVSFREAPPSPTHPGLLYDGGRDVAVAFLEDCVRDVRTADIDEIDKNPIGKRYEIAGFGYTDAFLEEYGFYVNGIKYKGQVTGRALSGRWYELLFGGDYEAYLAWYLEDAVTGTPTEDEAAAWWDAYTLEPGYELLAGGLPGESLGCFGDSGGPLLKLPKGKGKSKLTIVGVSFAVESSVATLCTRGGGYAILNREMKRFVDQALRHRP